MAGNLIKKLLELNYIVYGSVREVDQARYLKDINREKKDFFHLVNKSTHDILYTIY